MGICPLNLFFSKEKSTNFNKRVEHDPTVLPHRDKPSNKNHHHHHLLSIGIWCSRSRKGNSIVLQTKTISDRFAILSKSYITKWTENHRGNHEQVYIPHFVFAPCLKIHHLCCCFFFILFLIDHTCTHFYFMPFVVWASFFPHIPYFDEFTIAFMRPIFCR